jgi:GTP-binding protein
MKDLARIYVKAGDGGNGSVHFRHEKFAPKGGPDGGDGGRGGDVILVADENVPSLVEFNYQKRYEAKHGEQGYGKKMHGENTENVVVRVPVGTVVWEIDPIYKDIDMRNREYFDLVLSSRKLLMDMTEHDTQCTVAYGGRGGRGNWQFRSASNQVPMQHEDGKPGEAKWLLLEQKVVADVGIVGLPNAGKSSLLAALTRANPKIAGYPFTTLEPNLGVLMAYDTDKTQDKRKPLVLVDVPGVVEEAWEGKGIGPWFLRHLERCQTLLHVVAIAVSDKEPGVSVITKQLLNDYEIVRRELVKYGNGLPEKKVILVVNKRELVAEAKWEKIREALVKKLGVEVTIVSAAMNEGVEEIIAAL